MNAAVINIQQRIQTQLLERRNAHFLLKLNKSSFYIVESSFIYNYIKIIHYGTTHKNTINNIFFYKHGYLLCKNLYL